MAAPSPPARPASIERQAPPPPTPSEGALRAAAEHANLQVGVATNTKLLREHPDLIAANFTSLTAENELKWRSLAPEPERYDFAAADRFVAFAEQHGQRMRGHTLVWARLNGTPRWLEAEVEKAADPPERLRELIRTHIATTVGRYRGRIAQWDVVNEPLASRGGDMDLRSIFQRHLGTGYIAEAFRLAAAADPNAQLFLNEVFTERDERKFASLVTLARELLDAGVPIHGIGLQGHFTRVPNGVQLERKLRRVAELGLLVEMTEVDMPIQLFAGSVDPLEAQARSYADVTAACLNVERCTGVTMWGLSDAHSWLDSRGRGQGRPLARPLLFDTELQPKSAYFAMVRTLLAASPKPSV